MTLEQFTPFSALALGLAAVFFGYKAFCTSRNAFEFTTSLMPEMAISVSGPGAKTIYVKALRGSNLGRLSLSLVDRNGESIALKRVLVPATVTGISMVRVSWATFTATSTGPFSLRASGLENIAGPSEILVFRSHGLQMAGWIVAIVLAAFGCVGSIASSIIL